MKIPRGKLISIDQAKPAANQHQSPCSDCPFRRDSLRGWLGGYTAQEFAAMAHGEDMLECHVIAGKQCAGAGIYRANVCKDPRNRALIVLPADKKNVLGSRAEFIQHHTLPKKGNS